MATKSDTLNDALLAASNTFRSAYSLAPAIVIVGLILAAVVIGVSLVFVEILMGLIIILIIIISILIYYKSNNYGEAALALMAGLLAAFTVDWTWNKSVVFLMALLGVMFFILLIESMKLTAKSEEIYVRAAVCIDVSRSKEIEKQLREIADDAHTRRLGPIEKADAILIMAFRKIPIDSMKYMLGSIEIITGITKLSANSVTLFLIDLSKALRLDIGPDFQRQIDGIFNIYRDAPISHEEFIKGFDNSKRIVISGKIDPSTYLSLLKLGFAEGVSPDEINDYIHEKYLDS